jgi:ArsR family transcriptional regulator
MDGYQQAALILKALAHPMRLRIIESLLDEEEACVCHLEQQLGLRQAYLSQQLASLRTAGLVSDRRDGLNIYYSITAPGLESLIPDVRRLAIGIAEKDGMVLSFPSHKRAGEEPCGCPRCEPTVTLSSS